MTVLVDANVVLDVITDDPQWCAWSLGQMNAFGLREDLAINDVVFAELGNGFASFETLEEAVADMRLLVRPMPREALFLASKVHARYRRAGGSRTGVLPDFFIGAQAAVERLTLLTRDPRRYRTYFPTVELIAP